ncbi:MAG TPA: glycosyltransferase family 4 protein [Candidatus Caenarcaniphilales bacterium]
MGGGVELTLQNMAQILRQRGHIVEVIAPQGSQLKDTPVLEIDGVLQVPAQTQERTAPIVMPGCSVLARLWDYARQVQAQYDLIINFAYDWLPFYLTPFFTRPIAHLISMGSLTDAMDHVIAQVAVQAPGTLGVHTQTQAATFPFADQCRHLGSGLELSLYHFCGEPGQDLCWMGRLAPEKGLEDAVAAVQATGTSLKILGHIGDQAYWQRIQAEYPEAPIEYLGFLPTTQMQQVLRRCRALLVTSRWVEAFGNVLIEALACGVPVIAYERGGPAEIVQDGKTGWLVKPDSVPELIAAIKRIDQIDRAVCRRQAELEYSLQAFGDRLEKWFAEILTARR